MIKTVKHLDNGRIRALLPMLLAVIMLCLPTVCVRAQTAEKVVRVGWYESPFNKLDDLGRRSGYAYEYQQEIAAYSGWRYEYVEGTWSDLMQMLIEGKIDMMSDVAHTEDYQDKMLFPSLPMGTEEYYLFTTPDNDNISTDDYTTFNGKKVGANAESVQADCFREWAKAKNVEAELVELTGSDSDNIAKLIRGDIDLYVSLNAIAETESTVPVCKIGSSDFYFAVNQSRPDLLTDLNAAMNKIHDTNIYFNQNLQIKYLQSNEINLILSKEETQWLSGHSVIRLGYQDNYLAFCAKDPKTGKLTGALKDYLEMAATCFDETDMTFEPVAYPTADAALEALKKGEIDCMFPVNFSDYYGEAGGYLITSPLMNTEMSAVVLEANKPSFFKKERVTVAVNVGNSNYDIFLLDHFPDWQPIYFKDTPECLRAVADGKADCLLLSSYRYNNISKLCEKLHLTNQSTGVTMDYCFAVRRDNSILYSIISKINSLIPLSVVDTALTHYFTEDAKTGFIDLVRRYVGIVICIGVIILLLILLLIRRHTIVKNKITASQQLIEITQKDQLTGLYNKNYFMEYANRLHLENPNKPMDAIVINIQKYHSVVAINGHAFGNKVIRELSHEILDFVQEEGGIAGYIPSDRFAIFGPHLEDYRLLYDRLQCRMDILSTHAVVQIRMGVMPWQSDADPHQLIDQARTACNMARKLYQERLLIFDDEMRKKESYERRLLNDLHRAIKEHEFIVHYQPKYDIRSEEPRLVSTEALVRWRHPDFGLIPPQDFILLFERNNQIGAVDKYVWAQAAKQVARWRDQYGFVLPVSINLSRLDIFDPQLEDTLDSLLAENQLDHNALLLEVTESAYTENAVQFIGIIERLQEKGYKIEMDDFGSGYSSLNMLSAMPIDVLKMDSAFIKDIEHSEQSVRFVDLILDIAKQLKVPVIAEGVETEEQLHTLRKMGCDMAQGYYFARPLPPEVFEKEILKKEKSDA